jgi:hypothetical protein
MKWLELPWRGRFAVARTAAALAVLVGVAAGLVRFGPRWWPEALVLSAVALVLAAMPWASRPFEWPWRGASPVRNTVAFYLHNATFVGLVVWLAWRGTRDDAWLWGLAVAFTLGFVSDVVATKHSTRWDRLFSGAFALLWWGLVLHATTR